MSGMPQRGPALAQTLFKRVFESCPDGIAISDSSGQILEINPQLQRLFGYASSELQGQPIETLVPERFRSKHPEYRKDYARSPRARPMGAGLELYGRRKDGSEFPID